ncbi:MAG TPA: hypothetical protein VNR11_13255 [Xanthobacteraceae bacterium]|nr:hypothetical protein [Xanthobacteraceae bacterium]
MNNASFETADRNTHVKIVVVSLIASIAVLVVGISARTNWADDAAASMHAKGPPIKAGQPVVVTDSKTSVIR